MVVPIPAAANSKAQAKPQAKADAKAQAKKHFKTGNSLYLAEDYSGAAVEFEESVDLYPTQNGLFNLANIYKALHRYSESQAVLERLKKDFGTTMHEEMRTRVEQLDSEIRALVCKLDIEVQPQGATIRVNGEKRGESPLDKPLLLSPGNYEISVTLAGYETAKKNVRLVAGSKRAVDFKMQRSEVVVIEPEPEDLQETEEESTSELPSVALTETNVNRLSPLFWVSAGVTVVSAAAMTVFVVLCKQSYDDFKKYKKQLSGLIEEGKYDEDIYDLQVEAEEDTKLFWGLSLGFTIGTGVLVATTLAIMALDLTRTKRLQSVAVTASPTGLVISF